MRLVRTALAVALLAATAACGSTDEDPGTPPASTAQQFPVTIGSVTLEKQPTRIVSLAPVATEMLFAIGAGKQVVAVDDQSNFPADAPKTDLSGFKPNVEAIAKKNPDFVVVSNDIDKIVDGLTRLKIPVYLAPAAKTLDDTYKEINDLGKLTGHGDEATDLVTRMKDDIAKLTKDIKPRAKKLTYYHELDPALYSVTSKTFIGSVYALFGLENVADPADADGKAFGYPQLSAEAIVKANPDLIFLADSKCCQQNGATVKARAGWADVNAVKNDRVITLDDDVASRWGPRIVDFVRVVADAVAKVPA